MYVCSYTNTSTCLKYVCSFYVFVVCAYRRPVRADTVVLLNARIDKLEGRKLYMSANVTDVDGNELACCTAVFIALKVR